MQISIATEEAVQYIAQHLKQSDIDEIKATWHDSDILSAILVSMSLSEAVFNAYIDGVPCAVFGYGQYGNRCCVWLLTTDAIKLRKKSFMREAKRFVREVSSARGILYNYVSQANLQWVKALGFKTTGRKTQQGLIEVEYIP
jgi:hypothetical protein